MLKTGLSTREKRMWYQTGESGIQLWFSPVTRLQLRVASFLYLLPILVLNSYFVCTVPRCQAQQGKKAFTVADDIGLTQFGDPYTGKEAAVQFSPDGRYFAVDTAHGRLDLNRVEGSMRFYRSRDIETFLKQPDASSAPKPVWIVTRSEKEAPVFKDWRWLADSGGVAFLGAKTDSGHPLMLADLRKKRVKRLTSPTEAVDRFEVRDRNHYVYTAADWTERKKTIDVEHQAPGVVGTGRNLFDLVLPDDPVTASFDSPPTFLWAVVGGRHFEVRHNGALLVPEGGVLSGTNFAMSPDYGSIVAELPVPEVPSSWEALYPPPYASSRDRIHAGHGSVRQYVQINLQTGSIHALTDAPISNDAGWLTGDAPSWSSDGQAILLPATFLKSKVNTPSRPCVAVVDLRSNTTSCVETLRGIIDAEGNVEKGYHFIFTASFIGGDKHRIKVTFLNHEEGSTQSTDYHQDLDGTWHVAPDNGLKVSVEQRFDEPPRLVATDDLVSRVVWDPNPEIRNLELGQVSVYKWKDKTEGGEWEGGLYKPPNYQPGQRYPLVIQTHGFEESIFSPAGSFPTANAARELAVKGIMVLQTANGKGRGCGIGTIKEGPCMVSLAESAATQLVSEGLVDPERIGVIGFSRTCFHVMEMLTKGSLRLKAASITDGVMFTYSQYILFTERASSEANVANGIAPFGEGLQQWLKRSPGFNLDRISTPLMVVGLGPVTLLAMWEPYAGLHYLHKPVEVVMLNTHEHVLTNPAIRLASQGGSVDWFRFWLQGYEDTDPAKAEQYKRWRELRRLQTEIKDN
jgi:dipeptidyl aminopeptidase/acylaminoacyl peptidase